MIGVYAFNGRTKYFDSVKKVAEYLLPGIEIYSKYIISKDFEWNFTIDDKDFQPLFNELNKYIMGPTFRWHRLMEKAAV